MLWLDDEEEDRIYNAKGDFFSVLNEEEEKTVRKKAFEISYNALRADRFQGERRRTLNRLFYSRRRGSEGGGARASWRFRFYHVRRAQQ